MLKNIDKLNKLTLEVLPLTEPDDIELMKTLYDRGIKLEAIEVCYNSLDDYYSGKLDEPEPYAN